VYDVITYRLQRRLTVPYASWFTDMTSCEHNRCVYIGGYKCVHRLDVQGTVTQFAVNDTPFGLSVNAAHKVLLTCPVVAPKIKEFSSHGVLLRELRLPDDVFTITRYRPAVVSSLSATVAALTQSTVCV